MLHTFDGGHIEERIQNRYLLKLELYLIIMIFLPIEKWHDFILNTTL